MASRVRRVASPPPPPPPIADTGSNYQGCFPGVGREGEGDGCSGRQSTRWLSRMTHITCNVLPIGGKKKTHF